MNFSSLSNTPVLEILLHEIQRLFSQKVTTFSTKETLYSTYFSVVPVQYGITKIQV